MTLDCSFGATVGRIAPVIPTLLTALNLGTDAANEYWATYAWRRRHYPQLWSHLVRTHALEHLREAGLTAHADDEDASTPPMSALLIQHGYDILKVRLSQDGDIPLPGDSEALTAYYRQQPQIAGMETNNLIVLWRHEEGRLMEPLQLVRPVGGGRRRRDLVVGWLGPIDRQVATLRAADLDELRPTYEQPALGSNESA